MKVLLVESKISVVDVPLKEAIKAMSAEEFIKSLPIYGKEDEIKRENLGKLN